jgi:hypothetical protein
VVVKTIQLTRHIRFRVPDDWTELATAAAKVRLQTADGGVFEAVAHEFRKPAKSGAGRGPAAEQMVSAQVKSLGVSPRALSPDRAMASHPVRIGDPGHERECRVWHLVNQVAAWHHEVLLFTYEPAAGGELNPSIVSFLDDELARCEFTRTDSTEEDQEVSFSSQSRPWWKFW